MRWATLAWHDEWLLYSVTGQLAGRPVVGAPSAYAQARLDVTARGMTFTEEPIGFELHVFLGNDVVSYVQAINRDARRRVPTGGRQA